MIAPFGAPQGYNPLSRAKHQTAGYQQIAVEALQQALHPGSRFAIYDLNQMPGVTFLWGVGSNLFMRSAEGEIR
jgi:hypothetical protein